MTRPTISEVVENHILWLDNPSKGKRLNLTNKTIRGRGYEYVTFLGKDLSKAIFEKTDLYRADFMHTKLVGVDFKEADLTAAKFIDNPIISETDFSYSDSSQTQFVRTSLQNVNFQYAQLRNSSFSSCELQNVDFSYANLCYSKLCYSKIGDIEIEGVRGDDYIIRSFVIADVHVAYTKSKLQIGPWSVKVQNRNYESALKEIDEIWNQGFENSFVKRHGETILKIIEMSPANSSIWKGCFEDGEHDLGVPMRVAVSELGLDYVTATSLNY